MPLSLAKKIYTQIRSRGTVSGVLYPAEGNRSAAKLTSFWGDRRQTGTWRVSSRRGACEHCPETSPQDPLLVEQEPTADQRDPPKPLPNALIFIFPSFGRSPLLSSAASRSRPLCLQPAAGRLLHWPGAHQQPPGARQGGGPVPSLPSPVSIPRPARFSLCCRGSIYLPASFALCCCCQIRRFTTRHGVGAGKCAFP